MKSKNEKISNYFRFEKKNEEERKKYFSGQQHMKCDSMHKRPIFWLKLTYDLLLNKWQIYGKFQIKTKIIIILMYKLCFTSIYSFQMK